MSIVPIIDISAARGGDEAARRAVARQIGDACENVGFLMVTGHGFPPGLLDAVDRAAREFFALPQDEKAGIAILPGKPRRGYSSVGTSTLVARPGENLPPPDLRESLVTGPEPVPGDPYYDQPGAKFPFQANVWPERPEAMKQAFGAYYAACAALAATLMRLFALALDLPETFFDDKIDHHISGLNATFYPRQPSPPEQGQLRAGQHTDYGSLTILATDGSPGGLQVWLDGAWQDVQPVPGAFIINLGDLMAQWTNDRWRSTLHRVVNPPRAVAANTDRLSLVFFHQPNFDARVECLPTCLAPGEEPKYPPTSSGEHLRAKIASTYAQEQAVG